MQGQRRRNSCWLAGLWPPRKCGTHAPTVHDQIRDKLAVGYEKCDEQVVNKNLHFRVTKYHLEDLVVREVRHSAARETVVFA